MDRKNSQIQITVNKKPEAVASGIRVAELLERRGITSKASVWINGRQLLLAEYPNWEIKDGDQVKILRIIGGG